MSDAVCKVWGKFCNSCVLRVRMLRRTYPNEKLLLISLAAHSSWLTLQAIVIINNVICFFYNQAFVCVGAKARVELAESSNLEIDPINGGIMVNTELEARKHLYVVCIASSLTSN